MGMFDYNKANLLGGAVRIGYAPIDEPIPTDISDIFEMEAPYALQGTWETLGGTRDGLGYGRSIAAEGQTIQQETGNVYEEITEVARAVDLSLAEITPSGVSLLEHGDDSVVDTIAAAAGKSAQHAVPFGSIEQLTPYRVFFAARRARGIGADVTESDGTVRGALVAWVGYECRVAAGDSAVEFAKGNLSALPITMALYPISGAAEGEEHGTWLFEDPGTIA